MSESQGVEGKHVPAEEFVGPAQAPPAQKKKRSGKKKNKAAREAEAAATAAGEEGFTEASGSGAAAPEESIAQSEQGAGMGSSAAEDALSVELEEAMLRDDDDDADAILETVDAADQRRKDALWKFLEANHSHIKAVTRHRLSEFLISFKHHRDDHEFQASVRQLIWRPVVRANFFFVNPYTGEPTGKVKPLRVTDSLLNGSFDQFVECTAERLDRVGRDLPDAEYVKKIEDDVRLFLKRADQSEELAYLAFLLLFEEGAQYVLKVEQMQERVRLAFKDKEFDWEGLEIMVMGPGPRNQPPPNSRQVVAGQVWKNVLAELETME